MYRLRLLLSIYTLKRKRIQCTFCSVCNNGVISFEIIVILKKIDKNFQYNVSISPWYNFQLTIIIIIIIVVVVIIIVIIIFMISISFAIIIIVIITIIIIIIIIIIITMMMMMMIIQCIILLSSPLS